MQLYEYLLVFKRRIGFFLTVVGVMLAIAIFMGVSFIPRYDVTTMMTFAIEDTQETVDYKYSNFYAEQAALEFTRTVSGWYKDPYFKDHVFRASSVDYDNESTFKSKLLGFFSMKRVERQNIHTSFSATSKTSADALAAGLKKVIVHRLDAYNDISKAKYKLAYDTVFVEKQDAPWALLLIGSLFFSIILGLFLLYVMEGLRGVTIVSDNVVNQFGKKAYDIVSKGQSIDQRYLRMRILEEKPFSCMVSVGSQAKLIHAFDLPIFQFPNDTAKNKDLKETILVVVELGKTTQKDLVRVKSWLENKKWEYIVIQ